MEQFIQVVEEDFDDPVEIPIETDGTLLLSTLAAQFPGATGLKYRNETTGNWRGIRLTDGKLQAPGADSTWSENIVFCVVYPKGHTAATSATSGHPDSQHSDNIKEKRKGEHVFDSSGTTAKMKRPASENSLSRAAELQKTSDLVILGLAYTAEEGDLKDYFEKFGEVLMTQIKRDHQSGKSKGFGFIRMADYESQMKVLSQRHMICGRWCDTRLPNSSTNKQADSDLLNRKIFVGRCTEEITQEDLRNYFSKFGEVVDVYIPKPFRAFAFVTFASPQVASQLCGEDHIIGNASVHISSADPKEQRGRDGSSRGADDSELHRRPGGRSSPSGPPVPSNMGGGNQPGGANGPNMNGGNMPNMAGFNMNNFPVNPAMFAALAAQGMFGMPNMMGGGPPMGGYPNQQQGNNYNNQPPNANSNNFSYNGYGGNTSGYNNGPGYGQPGGAGGSNAPGPYTSMWGNGANGDSHHKDIKGTAGWGQSQSKNEPMNSSWNNL